MVQLDESNIEIQVFSFFFLNILNGSGSIRQQIRSIFFSEVDLDPHYRRPLGSLFARKMRVPEAKIAENSDVSAFRIAL